MQIWRALHATKPPYCRFARGIWGLSIQKGLRFSNVRSAFLKNDAQRWLVPPLHAHCLTTGISNYQSINDIHMSQYSSWGEPTCTKQLQNARLRHEKVLSKRSSKVGSNWIVLAGPLTIPTRPGSMTWNDIRRSSECYLIFTIHRKWKKLTWSNYKRIWTQALIIRAFQSCRTLASRAPLLQAGDARRRTLPPACNGSEGCIYQPEVAQKMKFFHEFNKPASRKSGVELDIAMLTSLVDVPQKITKACLPAIIPSRISQHTIFFTKILRGILAHLARLPLLQKYFGCLDHRKAALPRNHQRKDSAAALPHPESDKWHHKTAMTRKQWIVHMGMDGMDGMDGWMDEKRGMEGCMHQIWSRLGHM